MKEINLSTGEATFTINGDESRTITFCPTDYGFIKRMEHVCEQLGTKQEGWSKEGAEAKGDIHKLMEVIDGAEKEIRSLIDYAFDAPVSETVFRNMSVYSLSDGVPLWVNFLAAIFEVCESASSDARKKNASPRLEKLLKKYGKKG